MKKLVLTSILALGLLTTVSAKETVNLQHFKKLVPGVTVTDVVPSKISGLYEVIVEESPYPIYVTQDGKFMIEGQMIDLVHGVNLTEERLNVVNKELIAKVEPSDMIIYKADNEKHVVSIFTDIDCPYCQMLHREMGKYHDAGITVRYLAFPRMGLNSQAYRDLVSVWCADDPMIAMNAAKLKKKFKAISCESNPVASQYELGKQIGISGTPAIILEDGSVIGGYVPAKDLEKMLKNKGL